jgi:hypothetical protein
MSSLSQIWGTASQERLLDFPCDHLIEVCDDTYFRGISIKASPEVIFRWLCQMRIAPYSYDWIDNLGRQSPRKLASELDELSVGQDVMTIFELVDFRSGHHLTIRVKRNRFALRMFGDVAVSYIIVPKNAGNCRLLVKPQPGAHHVQFLLGNDDATLGLFAGIGINIISRRKLNKDKGDNGYQKEGNQGRYDSPC